MRILHSIVLDGWSAGSWYAVNMARQLNTLGHENLFVCRPDCRTQREAAQAGLQVHDTINLEQKNPLRIVANLSALGGLLIDWKPDVVEVFAGMLDYKKYPFFDRIMIQFIMWMTKGPTNSDAKIEYTDWDRVNDFGIRLLDF